MLDFSTYHEGAQNKNIVRLLQEFCEELGQRTRLLFVYSLVLKVHSFILHKLNKNIMYFFQLFLACLQQICFKPFKKGNNLLQMSVNLKLLLLDKVKFDDIDLLTKLKFKLFIMKKLLLLLIVLCTIGFVGAQNAGDNFNDGIYTFEVVEPGISVKFPKRTGSASLAVSGALVLPSTATGFFGQVYSVIETGESSFNGLYINELRYDVTSITIPGSIATIGFRTFRGCEAVESYILEEGITTIGGQAFQDNKALTSIVLPNSVTTIGNSTFNGCSTLTSLTLSQNLTQIPDRAFPNCPVLTQLSVPASVTDFLAESWYSSSITTLIMEGAVPPVINPGWNGTAANMTVYTDAANIDAYKAAPIWADMEIKDSATLSTKKVEQEFDWGIYPNPTSGLVSVKGIENINNITLYNVTGTALLNSNSPQIDLSSLASGIYFIKVKTANGTSVKRVLKK